MPKDNMKNTIIVALCVAVICSLFVCVTSVMLKSIQEKNKTKERIKNILIAGDIYYPDISIQKLYKKKVRPELINLQTGKPASKNDKLPDIKNFTIKKAINNLHMSTFIKPENDIAKISRKPKYVVIFKVIKNNKLDKVILPIVGKGLWSTMYGFIALDEDIKTVAGFTIYEHGETPGLGGEVDNPLWKNIWKGKIAYNSSEELQLKVIKGQVERDSLNSRYCIDGLSGATITTRGVDAMIQFWLSDKGYKKYLEQLWVNKADSSGHIKKRKGSL